MDHLPKGIPLELVLNDIIAQIPNEDPLKYADIMYESINPALISWITMNARDFIRDNKALNDKKGTKEANIYFTMGVPAANKSLFLGFIASFLWLSEYVQAKGRDFHVTEQEEKTFNAVMRKMGIPCLRDIFFPDPTQVRNYSTKNYAACLSNFAVWLARSSLANKESALHTRSNKEVCELLTTSALGTWPAVPFTAYYLGTVKTTKSIPDLAEICSKNVQFKKYLSDDFMKINNPTFLVTTSNAPVVDMVGHPLSVLTYGLSDPLSKGVEWFAGFSETEEFDKLCMKYGITPKDVKKYMITTGEETYNNDLERGHPIAKFIDGQNLTKALFNNLKGSRGLLGKEENYL